MDRAQQVAALIANSDWGEADMELLMGMSDEAFARVEGVTLKTNAEAEAAAEKKAADEAEAKKKADVQAANAGTEPEMNEDGTPKAKVKVADKPQTLEQVLEGISDPDLKGTLSRAVARDKEVKANMIADLVANKSCVFTAEQLAAKSIEELEGMLKLAGSEKKATDFSARVPAVNIAGGGGVPKMPVLCADKKG